MPTRITWSKLAPGLIGLGLIVLLAIGVIVFAGVGKVRGEKIRLYVLTDQARGLLPGSEVWLAGQKIGTVERVNFRPPTTDTASRLVIVTTVRKRDAAQIRRDSEVSVRPGTNVIGPVVVYIAAGSAGSRGVGDGDTLYAGRQPDAEAATAALARAASELGPLIKDARTVVAHVRNPEGSIGAFMAERAGGGTSERMTQLWSGVSRLRGRMMDGNGEPGFADLGARVTVTMARADSIRSLLQSPGSSLGRFRRDSTLAASIAQVRDDLTALRATLDSTEGTAGRWAKDSALTQAVTNAQREMARLFRDVRRRPLAYVHF